jgi:hypothetical protein
MHVFAERIMVSTLAVEAVLSRILKCTFSAIIINLKLIMSVIFKF